MGFEAVERACEASHGVSQLGAAPYAGSRTTASGAEGFTREALLAKLEADTLPDPGILPRGTPMASALDGVTVLDLSTGPAAGLATMFLADHGACVVRPIDAQAPHLREGGFVVWDRGKACTRLDLDGVRAELKGSGCPARGTPAAEYARLLRGADVLVEDFAPNSARQRLVAWPSLQQLNPRLVACSLTAYGKRGPWKDDPAIDELVLARTGLLSGMPGFRPAPV